MVLVDHNFQRDIDSVERAIKADPAAWFLYDLVTHAPPMDLATVKAASDAAAHARDPQPGAAARGGRRRAPRLRLVAPVLPLPGPGAPISGLGT